jgi:hypothetical protein
MGRITSMSRLIVSGLKTTVELRGGLDSTEPILLFGSLL